MSKKKRSAQTQPETVSLETTKEPAQLPVDLPSVVALDVFSTVGGHKWDQMAGFIRYAKTKKMGPRTVSEWRAELDAFLNRPVG